MRRVHLDFVTTHRATGWSDWILLSLGVAGVAGLMAWNELRWQPLNAAAEAHLHSLETKTARSAPTPRLNDVQLVAEWTRAITIANELNLPWDALFTTFEAEADRPVAILALEPDAVKHECAIAGEAKNFEEMLAYYRLLQQKDIFSDLALHTHQINRQDRENPIRFRITAKWMAKS